METPTIDTKCVQVRISGRVQGVWFRGWTREQALLLGLSGWVRNRRDGTVEVVFLGQAKDVDHMIKLCRTGPSMARVDTVEVTLVEAEAVAVSPSSGFYQQPSC